MATLYDKTPKLGLNLYGDNDPADLRDGHNENMTILDEQVDAVLTGVEGFHDDIENLKEQKADVGVSYSKDESDARKSDTDAQVALKADQTTVDALSSKISNLADTKADKGTSYTKVEVDASQSAQDANISANANSISELKDTIVEYPTTFMVRRIGKPTIVIAGDSITYGTGASTTEKSWGNRLGATIDANVTNLAANNAGYVNAPTFLSQLQGYSGDKNAVTHVIIAGGANDKTAEAATVKNAAKNCYVWALSNFPHAEIIVLPVLLGVNGIFRYHANIPSTLQAIESAISETRNVREIHYAWEWLNGREDWASTSNGFDAIHSNDLGQEQLLRIIPEAIFSRSSVHNNWTTSAGGIDNHGNVTNSSCVCANGILSFDAQFTVVNGHQSYNSIVQASYGLSKAKNYHIASSYAAGNTYVSNVDVGSVKRAVISCDTSIPNNTEIYASTSHYIGA